MAYGLPTFGARSVVVKCCLCARKSRRVRVSIAVTDVDKGYGSSGLVVEKAYRFLGGL